MGQRIAQARRELACREKRDVTPSAIAKALKVSRETVYRWEADVPGKQPRDAKLIALAKFLGVTASWLRYGDEEVQDAAADVQPDPAQKASRHSRA